MVCIHDGWMIRCMQKYSDFFCGCGSMYVYIAQIMVGAERGGGEGRGKSEEEDEQWPISPREEVDDGLLKQL